jgi:hypothetical protein
MVLANGLLCMASVDNLAGLDERAQRLLGANEAWHAARDRASRTWASSNRGPLMWGPMPIPATPTEVRLIRARAEGRAMSLEEAVTYALSVVPPMPAVRS